MRRKPPRYIGFFSSFLSLLSNSPCISLLHWIIRAEKLTPIDETTVPIVTQLRSTPAQTEIMSIHMANLELLHIVKALEHSKQLFLDNCSPAVAFEILNNYFISVENQIDIM